MDTIRLLSPAGLVQSPAFSHVAVVPPGATTIHVGGQNGVDASGKVVGDDVVSQTRQALANLRTALESVGASVADVVSWSILVEDGVDLAAGAAVAGEVLDPHRPSPLITVARVSGLGPPGAVVEISAVAAVVR
ncbi:hypothetical protein CHO01_12080 [Cellulomonas hominis]|uniref:Enamine deaminase RidA (YjgF/YER057c/UK114 family) n=1 Tax=Cellulomonas hominis TaxID=156981 RepID=A0A511FA18_9CELL|nr:RidA family protein [Cellulomonas hominis]MBB5474250.1 enamine deaminase RidA (YjgF/YER057c/UK114 family) [Cellulomonas hominis]GEL46092.1 hypothetical protein CHO01_12080 [Cellulomonas hominis]